MKVLPAVALIMAIAAIAALRNVDTATWMMERRAAADASSLAVWHRAARAYALVNPAAAGDIAAAWLSLPDWARPAAWTSIIVPGPPRAVVTWGLPVDAAASAVALERVTDGNPGAGLAAAGKIGRLAAPLALPPGALAMVSYIP